MEEKKEKLTYEQLEQYAAQLSQQAQQMYAKLQEMNMTNMFKRLDYLFKVLENNPMFGMDFVNKCVEEIQSIMTPPVVEEPKEEEEVKEETED